MQITFDTANARPAELSALARFIQDLAALQTAPDTVALGVDPSQQIRKLADEAKATGIVIPPIGAGKPVPVNLTPTIAPPTVGGFATVRPAIVSKPISAPIAPADQPDAGAAPVDDQQAAAIFGAQRIDAAPAASVPSIPTAPAAPAAAVSPASVTAPPSTAAAPLAGVELDSQGLPWDPRIHGSTKAKNADGTWRQRRGLNDPELKKKVEAELRATMALPAAPTPPAAPVPGVPVAPAARPWETANEQYLAGTPTPPVVNLPPMPAPPATFGAFMSEVSNLVAGKTMTSEHVTLKLQGIGLASIMALANRPDLIPTAWQALHS